MLDSEADNITLQGIQNNQVPTLKCIAGVEADQVCMNKNCKEEQAILCNTPSCQCLKVHKFCFRTPISSVIEIIQEKAYALKNIEEKINKIFENLVDKLSQTRDNFIRIYQNLFKTKSYFPIQKEFLNEVHSGEGKKLTGLMTSKIYDSVYIREELDKKIVDSAKRIDQFNEKFNVQFNQFGISVQKELITLCDNIVGQNIETLFDFRLMKQSQIIKYVKEENKMFNLIPSKIEQITLLYAGSKHNFSGQAFHKLCDDKGKIFILIRTKHNKIIGAYAPNGLSSSNRRGWVADYYCASFLFSFTEGVKLKLQNSSYSYINYYDSDSLLCSFGNDLKIANNGNKNNSSINFRDLYSGHNYKNDSDGYRRFTGSQTSDFLIDEMQVWKTN